MTWFRNALFTLTAVTASLQAAAAERLVDRAAESIRTNDLLRHIQVLASDAFEGRAPGSKGEELTVEYLTGQFQALGLQPGNPNGTWTQDVPIVGVQSQVQCRIGGKELSYPQDVVAWSPRQAREVTVQNSELVFVGYGVVAPEYGWDDYKGVDVRGKTIVMLVNDPPVPDPAKPGELDPNVFKGKAMTYYGRWTYKYEIAAEKGAAAAIIIHETKPAAYPWFVVVNSWGRERFDLEGDTSAKVDVAAWITLERAQALFESKGTTYEAMKQAALSRAFKPVSLGVTADFKAVQTVRHTRSRNVVARREGRDPKLRDEWVVYTAHWDHLGVDPKLTGDTIFNGAADNASGTAGLLELAEAFAKAPRAPKRSVLFLALTAEEQGLLGAAYYARNPLYPLTKTLANVNMDNLNTWGLTRDVSVVGIGNSTLEDILLRHARKAGRVLLGEDHPERGYYYRSDHFEFAKVGVPALYAKGVSQFVGPSAAEAKQRMEEYTDKDYHKVSDEVKPTWDLRGAVSDLQLLLRVGWDVADGRTWPEWKRGSEFKARREAQLREAKR